MSLLIINYYCLERTIIVSEYYGSSLSSHVAPTRSVEQILRICFQISNALTHLNELGLVCHNLEPENILLDGQNNVKIFNYGLFHMTNGGQFVTFPIGYVHLILIPF